MRCIINRVINSHGLALVRKYPNCLEMIMDKYMDDENGSAVEEDWKTV